MEASDVTGELRLCMQVIATAKQEQKHYGTNVLEGGRSFAELMKLFAGLNHVVCDYQNGRNTREDVLFLQKNNVSEIAVQIAVMILKENKERIRQLQEQILKDRKKVPETLEQ